MLFAAVLRLEVASLLADPLVGRWGHWRTMIIANAGASGTTRVAAVLYFTDALAADSCTSPCRERHYLPVDSAGAGRDIRRPRSARLGILAISHIQEIRPGKASDLCSIASPDDSLIGGSESLKGRPKRTSYEFRKGWWAARDLNPEPTD